MSSHSLGPRVPGYDGENCRINLPNITIITDGLPAGRDIQVMGVSWGRDDTFNTARIRLHRLRFGTELPLRIGQQVRIVASYLGAPFTLFRGRFMNPTHRFSDPDKETVDLDCVGTKYDLFREVVFGQAGVGADAGDGTESLDGPLPGGLHLFTGLPTVFNPKVKVREREGENIQAGQDNFIGNKREGFGPFRYVFDCEPSLPADEFPNRRLRWSAFDMIEYLFTWATAGGGILANEPVITGGVGLPALGGDIAPPLSLGLPNGLQDTFPQDVNVEGLDIRSAITRACKAAGFSWWIDPQDNVLKFWRRSTGNNTLKQLWLQEVPEGFCDEGEVVLPTVDDGIWNVTSGQVTRNHLDVIDQGIAVSERIRVQNIFFLRKAWSDKIHQIIVDLVKTAGLPDNIAGSGTHRKLDERRVALRDELEDPKEHALIRLSRLTEPGVFNVTIQARGTKDQGHKREFDDGPFELFRKWGFDEGGLIGDLANRTRLPYNFSAVGLKRENGSTYCVGSPRPFLSRNVQLTQGGESFSPKAFFGKFHSKQVDRGKVKDVDENMKPNINPRQALAGSLFGSGVYPFVGKKGAIKFMKNVGGIRVEGGDLSWSVGTIDPILKEMHVFPPLVLGTIEHDQGEVEAVNKAVGGGFSFARRKLDGSNYRRRTVYAQDAQFVDDKETKAAVEAQSGALAALEEIDETDAMKEQLDLQITGAAKPRVAGRFAIPNIDPTYALGERITDIVGRQFAGPGSISGVIVSMSFDLTTSGFRTELTVQDEAFSVQRILR